MSTKLKNWHKRLLKLVLALSFIAAAVFFILRAFNQNIMLFVTPTDIVTNKNISHSKSLRLGGIVKYGSIYRDHNTLEMKFVITDLLNEIEVHYKGMLPSLFKEESGTIAKGYIQNKIFYAEEILAKHDENYIPREVVEALKKSGQWRTKSN